jgi:hypothetical protein
MRHGRDSAAREVAMVVREGESSIALDAEPVTAGRRRRPALPRGVLDVLAENSLLVVLVALLGTVLLALAPELLVADSWMTLAAGREIVDHGLPSHETLTVIAMGHRWTDQQWLAQVVFYVVDVIGGLRSAIVVDIALVTGTLALGVAAARRRGASARSTLFVACVCIFVAPWSWQLRAQALALPLFILVLELASADVRRPRPRTFLALPLVALWANVHGSVLLGAGMVSLAGCFGLVNAVRRVAGAPGIGRSLALVAAPWALLVASPYGLHLVGYYKLMLVSSPVSKVIVEWQAPKLHGWDLIFFGVAAATVVLAVWQRRRLALYDFVILAVTLAGSVRSSRGIVWFSLAVLVIVPALVDGAFGASEPPVRRRIGLATSVVATTVLCAALIAAVAQPETWFEKYWPAGGVRAAARAAAGVPGSTAVFPSDKHADWLLWKEPSLRGRVAYDVRFELLTGRQLNQIVRFKSSAPDWASSAAGYPILVLDPSDGKARIRKLEHRPGTRVLFKSRSVVVLIRRNG